MWKSWNGDNAIRLTESAIRKANLAALEAVGSAADQQVPLDEGTLLASKYIRAVGVKAFISYGGGPGTGFPRVPYAVRWHENSANFQHGRKKRYLADPLNSVGPRALIKALKIELSQALR